MIAIQLVYLSGTLRRESELYPSTRSQFLQRTFAGMVPIEPAGIDRRRLSRIDPVDPQRGIGAPTSTL
jgi:hypothetical protein